MSDAKNEVMKMIANRQRKNTAYRNKLAKLMGPNAIVLEFIDSMEKATKDCKTSIEFNDVLNRESKLLDDRMKRLDGVVKLEIIWNHSDKEEQWKDLSVDGVKITWGEFYLSKNPGEAKELHIDVSSLFIDGTLI